MQIDITNGKRFNEQPAIDAVSSGEDIILVRLADGTGVKALPLSALKSFIGGDQPHNNIQPSVVVYRWQRIA
jgi:microcystin-dependent protein